MEFFVLPSAPVQEFSPGPALYGLCESTHCLLPPLYILDSVHSQTTTSRPYFFRTQTNNDGGGERTNTKAINKSPPFLLELREM